MAFAPRDVLDAANRDLLIALEDDAGAVECVDTLESFWRANDECEAVVIALAALYDTSAPQVVSIGGGAMVLRLARAGEGA